MFGFGKKSGGASDAGIQIVDKKDHIVIIPKGQQVILAVDFSGSMDERDGDLTDGKSRLKYAEKQTVALALEANKIDPDGIDLITFSHDIETYWNTTADVVADAFRGGTRGSTRTDLAIRKAYQRHVEIGSTSTRLLIVTDGVPDRPASRVDDEIIRIAKAVGSPSVFMISFLTVGRLNSGTRDWLIQLDDDLKTRTGGVDIVDVLPLCGATFSAVQAGT